MNKVKLFIIAAIIIILLVVFVIVSFLDNESSSTTPATTIPGANPTIVIPAFDTTQLYITSITPLDTKISYLPVQPIQINFTQTVDIASFKYSVSPLIDTLVNQKEDQKSIIIAPKTIWTEGITTITIQGVTSTTGKVLKNPQSYKLNIAIPIIPNIEGAY